MVLSVEHLLYWGGPEETYHLTVTPYEPGFDVSVLMERWDAAQAGTFSVPIIVTRRDYVGPIDVSVIGPGLSGQVNIPAGAAKPPNVPSGTLTITVAENAPVGPLHFHLVGKATINSAVVSRLATYRLVSNQFLAALPVPPAQFETPLALAVRTRPPFTLSAKFDTADVEPGKPIIATVTANRMMGFAEEIVLTATGMPPTVKATLKPIPKGMNEVKIQFDAAPNATAGAFPVTFSGKAKAGMIEVIGTAAPASLVVVVVPFELKVEPTPLKIQQGAKLKLKVTAARRAYQGPIVLEVRNLPTGVTAPKATIPQAGTMIEVELTAAANAAVGDKVDVNVVGVGTPPTVTRTSPSVTVGVIKK